jgi:hypothetical protein
MSAPRKSLLRRLSIATGLALLLSIASAWMPAILHADSGGTDALATVEHGRGGWAHEDVGITHVQILDTEYMVQCSADAAQLPQALVIAPAVAVAEQSRRDQGTPAMKSEHVHAFGWPWRCLWYHAQGAEDFSGVEPAPEDPAIDLTNAGEASATKSIVIPLRPLWLGMLGNASVFGLAAFALLSIPTTVRALRRHRNCCESCGYALRGIRSRRCPECGHGVMPHPALA